MPARFVCTNTATELASLFGLSAVPEMKPRYNLAPPRPIPVVRVKDGARELTELQWGLIPHWSGDPPPEAHVNARVETVSRKPSFRDAYKSRRCLVPISGFYGWKPTGPRKQPYFFRPLGGGVLVCAGIWDRWTGLDATLETVAVLTMPANELIMPCDDRMPVVMREEHFATWLDPRNKTPEKALAPLVPYPADRMEGWPVSTRVNSPAIDDPDLITPIPEPQRG